MGAFNPAQRDIGIATPGGWEAAVGAHLGAGGVYHPVKASYIGENNVWRLSWVSGLPPAPGPATNLRLLVCRDMWMGPPDPVPTTWTARATWDRLPADASALATIVWQIYDGTIHSDFVDAAGPFAVGTANTHTWAFAVTPGKVILVRYRVQLRNGAGTASSGWAYADWREADYNNRDPACPVDPV